MSMGGKRQVFGGRKMTESPTILAGVKMHDQAMLLHDQIRKNQALENRIRRLAFEQQRAQKLTDIATEKAGKLLDARDRHQKKIEEKLRLQEHRR